MSAKIADDSLVILRLGLSDSITDEERALVSISISHAEGEVQRYLGYDPKQRVRTEWYPLASVSGVSEHAVWESTPTTAYLRRTSSVGSNELRIRHVPMRATDSDGLNAIDLRVDYDGRFGAKSGAFATDTLRVEGIDFWPSYDSQDSSSISVCKDGVVHSIGLWPEQPGSVKVTYVGGYTYNELSGQDAAIDASPIQYSVVEEAARRAKQALTQKKHGNLGWLPGVLKSEKLGDYAYTTDNMVSARLFSGIYGLLPETRERLSGFTNYSRWL